MSQIRPPADAKRQEEIRAELRRDLERREKSYRERALSLFPHVCARCSREFSGKRLRELTVHHKDHNHQNNPNDGSNWELLCLYCHDHEHEKYKIAGHYESTAEEAGPSAPPDNTPFAALDALLKPKTPEKKAED